MIFLLSLLVGLAALVIWRAAARTGDERNVALPPQLTEAIEQQQCADQESHRMEFIPAKERPEAERKRIEAKGISDFQTIVSQGISDQLL